MSDYTILRAADAPDFSGDDTPGAFLGYASAMDSEQLGVNVRVLAPGQSHVPPGMDPNMGHSHTDIEEIYIVIEGEVTFKLGDSLCDLGPGGCAQAPRGVVHGFAIRTETARLLILLAPGRIETVFREFSVPYDGITPPEAADVDYEAVERRDADFGVTFVGPPLPVLLAGEAPPA